MKKLLFLIIFVVAGWMGYWHFSDARKAEIAEKCIENVPDGNSGISFDRYGYCGCVAERVIAEQEMIDRMPNRNAIGQAQERIAKRCYSEYLEAALIKTCNATSQSMGGGRRLDCQCFANGLYAEYMRGMIVNGNRVKMTDARGQEINNRITGMCTR